MGKEFGRGQLRKKWGAENTQNGMELPKWYLTGVMWGGSQHDHIVIGGVGSVNALVW